MSSGFKRQGSEFRVNTTTAGNQTDAAMTALSSGGFVMTWTDASDGSGSGVRAQIYDAAGIAQGSEFLVNLTTLNNQSRSTVTNLTSGNFVVSWTDESLTGGDASGPSIKAQLFTSAGVRIGGEFLVNTTTTGTQTDASIVALSGGGFIASWADSSATAGDTTGTAIRAQIFDAGGLKVGAQFLVNTQTVADQVTPSISALATGGFVVTWADSSRFGGDTSGFAVKAQLYSAAGVRVGSEVLVNTTTSGNQITPVVTSLVSGKFVISWNDSSRTGVDVSGTAIKGQIFNADGTRSGAEFLINSTTLYTQQQPTIAALPGGGFAVAWSDNSLRLDDYSALGIKLQVFDDNGAKVGTEFTVNTTTTGNQEQPVITVLASGSIVVGWSDYSLLGGDASGSGIKAQIIAPNVGAISDINLSLMTLSEAAAQNTVAAVLTTNGALNGVFTYQLLSDSTGGAFRIDGDHLVIDDSIKLDFETSPNVSITVQASDGFGNSFTETLFIDISNALKESRFSASNDIRVNTVTYNDQVTSVVTKLVGGGFVVSWMDGSLLGGDASGYGIKGQIYNADGTTVGGEFLINTATSGSQSQPALTALSDGGFVAVWTDPSGRTGVGSAIVGQRYGDTGSRIGGEFLIGSTTSVTQVDAAVAGFDGGGFVVSWTDSSGQNGDTSNSAILARRYDAGANALGAAFLVNVATNAAQDSSTITTLDNGGFVVGWRDGSGVGGDNSSWGIKARVFDAGGNATGGEFLVNTQIRSAQLHPVVTTLAGGGFVMAWTDNSGIGGDADYYGIKAQIFDINGVRVGAEISVNTATLNSQQNPTLGALASGGFVVGWYDFSGTGGEAGGPGIRAQAFNAMGDKLGTEISANAETLGSQADPSLAGLASGSFVITYTDYSGKGGDDNGTSIKARIFTPLLDPGAPPALRATDDNFTGAEGVPQTILLTDVLGNDINGNAGILSIETLTAVVGGSVAFDVDGNILFTPNAGFDGRAAFDYRLADGTGATDIGRVFVQIGGLNDPPTANPDAVSASEDGVTVFGGTSLTGNDTDPDTGDILIVTSASAVSSLGAVISVASGNVSYNPGALFQSLRFGQSVTDSFSYTITDTGGLTSSAVVTVTVNGVNDTPFGLGLSNTNIDENSANGTVVGTAAASDVDSGDTLTYSLTNNAGGRFAIDAVTGVVTVANGALLDFETAASHVIGVRATDALGASANQNFTIALANLPEPRSYVGDNGANTFTATTNDFWTISGLDGKDVLTGNASADVIYGGTGADTLDGAGGADMLFGGVGDDIYFVDNIGDSVIELFGEGNDLVNVGVTFTLAANLENLKQTGTANIDATGNSFNNIMDGNTGNNALYGLDGRDLLRGAAGNDLLIGGIGNDWLQGGDGDDVLIGGAGLDELTGGLGVDRFVFDTLTVSADRETIKDFAPGVDKLELSVSVFTGFAGSPLGALSPTAFVVGAAATTADQHLIYTQSTGSLFYDADGNGAGAAVQIAFFSGNPVLASTDFNLIG